ncbi:Ppx/GppA phosphatase family protein [Streptomyces luteolus]|uniref:Ppx/GppA phosphatase family protein n=1 Tax=Streptomyces luteolus TaxID=3043615 RepID=A0ABT6SZY8_9ACTN|nr:Ppx/GppA phosphatase family protein [Streptomyces sp. B-S-A12]MDI3421159.1 Ppx/GppA phosphatase family protein [Streptomyces sp. B-S-A12]
MRMGVIDVGSNTVRLVVADTDGAVPLPVHTAKRALRLAEHVDRGGHVPDDQVDRIVDAVAAARAEGRRWGVTEPFAFATAIVRDAPNRTELLRKVAARTGLHLNVLPGEVEAELTFLAARRWMGWRAGPLAMLDIGGGSLEVAFGRSKLPDFALSLPLGAGRLTREFFGTQDPPAPRRVKALRRHVRHQMRDAAARVRWEAPRTAAATSRTFQQLGRLCGAAPGRFGPFTPRRLARADLRVALDELARRTSAERAELPGISAARARQSLAGAVVAHTVMKLTGIDELTICPWGLREGILLRCIEDGGAEWWHRTADVGLADPGGEPGARSAWPVPELQGVLVEQGAGEQHNGASVCGA